MPPLPTPHSSARWLAYGRADLEGIWNATMIIVSKGYLLAEDQTKNYTRCYVLCVCCLCHLRLRALPAYKTPGMGLENNTHVSPELSNIKHHIPDRTSDLPQSEPPGPHFFIRGICLHCGWWRERCTCGPG